MNGWKKPRSFNLTNDCFLSIKTVVAPVNSPEHAQPSGRIRGRSRRRRGESSSCRNPLYYQQGGTTSFPKSKTDEGQQPDRTERSKPGSGQGTDEKGIPDLEPPTGAQLATPNTAICGARDEMKIHVCHPHDPSDPTGVFIFPCRASKWHYYSL